MKNFVSWNFYNLPLLRKIFWNIYFWSMFTLVTSFCIVVSPVALLVQMLYHRPKRVAMRYIIRWYCWVLTQLVPFMAPVQVKIRGILPEVSVLVSNHNSAIDPYLLGALPIESGFVTSWAFRIPIYGWAMRMAQYANVEDGWDTVRDTCQQMLDDGCSVLVWPEGHRSRDGKLEQFRNGAFSLAVENDMPIVPVCILGARQILAPWQRFLNCGEVKMIVLEAVYPKGDIADKSQAIMDLRQRVWDMIEKNLHENGHFSNIEVKKHNNNRDIC